MTESGSEVLELYETMARIRATEIVQNDLWRRGLISGEMHSGIGEEGIVAGVLSHLTPGDAIACDHRPTGTFVARGVDIASLMLEMLGHEAGLNHGWAGHMHLMDEGLRIVADGIVGSSGPAACGFALSAEHLRPGSVAIAFFGEGAVNQGMLMESFNLAKVWRLPVLFVCKDNRWSITTRSREVSAGQPPVRAAAFGLRTKEVRGSNVIAVSRTARRLIDRMRSDREPAFLHARCFRPDGHFLGDPMLRVIGDPVGQAREIGTPLAGAARRSGGARVGHRVRALAGVGRRVAAAAVGKARQRPWDPVARLRRRLSNDITEAIDRRVEIEITEATERALAGAMARDPGIVVFGEDVRMLRRNLLVRFGQERVRDTPISESAFLGTAITAAMGGLKPIVEIMLVDFLGVAFDGLLNHAAKYESFSGGRWRVPLVVRATCGGGYGDGGQHEQALWGMLAGIPGLDVVVPSTPADAAGLMLTAIQTDGPVVFLEHKLLSYDWLDYLGGASRDTVEFDIPSAGARGPVPDPMEAVPLGAAITRRRGADVTLISLGIGAHRCLEAAEILAADGTEATVVDLRSVAPLDRDAVITAARDTGRVVVVDEDYVRGGLSGEIAAILAESGTDASFARVAVETTIPYARHLEEATLPNTRRIVAAVAGMEE